MQDRNEQTPSGGNVEATLDAFAARRAFSSSSGSMPEDLSPRVAVVEGSGPGLSGETQILLKTRLRAAALVLCLGSAAFFVRDLLYGMPSFADPRLAHEERFVHWFHLAHVLVLALVSYKLCWRCNLSLRAARGGNDHFRADGAVLCLGAACGDRHRTTHRQCHFQSGRYLVLSDVHLRHLHPEHLAPRRGDHGRDGGGAGAGDDVRCAGTAACRRGRISTSSRAWRCSWRPATDRACTART